MVGIGHRLNAYFFVHNSEKFLTATFQSHVFFLFDETARLAAVFYRAGEHFD